MIEVSITIPIYNEIRFIDKTIQSVIGEADEIVLSDNASSDGTSDICSLYASKYPEIKHIRHKENIGAGRNFSSCIESATGKFIRLVGAHDMISRFSTKSMLSLLENNQDAIMSYSKYVLRLNSDYSIIDLYSYAGFEDELKSESPFARVAHVAKSLADCTLYYGLYRADIFRKIMVDHAIFDFVTDHTSLANVASKGKILSDDKSLFFRMEPRKPEVVYEDQAKRTAIAITGGLCDNPYLWLFALIGEHYSLAREMQLWKNAPDDFAKTVQDIVLNRFGKMGDVEISTENFPSVAPDKKALYNEALAAVLKLKEQHQKPKKHNVLSKILQYLKSS